MPIPKNVKMCDCIGKYATVDRDIQNGAGHGISKGSKVKIVSFGRALDIKTEPCEHCGQYTKIYGVKKEELTLITDSTE